MFLKHVALQKQLFSEFARTGEEPPDGFMGRKAWAVISGYYQSLETINYKY